MTSLKYILGIDTSCDDTSFAVVDARDGRVKSNIISSQIEHHAPYGGVVPEIASRSHSENLSRVFRQSLVSASIGLDDISGVAVTRTPGLIGCLLVGTSFAKALAWRLDLPLFAVNHLEAHLFSPFIEKEVKFPFLGLVVSGGHTAFYRVESYDDIEVLGQTVDDAAGEAFDKCAKLMGLGYPGGPLVDKLAQEGDDEAFAFTIPRVKLGPEYLSFSGIKTALHHHVEKSRPLDSCKTRDLCASLQKAVVRTLLEKCAFFLEGDCYASLALSGGVAMNSLLRREATALCQQKNIQLHMARPAYCADNAAMVAHLALHRHPESDLSSVSTKPSQKIQARQMWGRQKSAIQAIGSGRKKKK